MAAGSAWLSSFYHALIELAHDAGEAMTQSVPSDSAGQIPALTVQPQAIANAPVPMAATLPAASAASLLITPMLLHKLGVQDADTWAEPISAACGAHGIDTPRRIAAFLANVMVETGWLTSLVESLNYDPPGLLRIWPSHFTQGSALILGRTASHPADQRGIAETACGGRLGNGSPGSGDGFKFRGRGLIQLTGRDNYARFAGRIGVSLDALLPRLEMPETAAISAAHFWNVSGCNPLADRGDIIATRMVVNGGANGLADVKAAYSTACAALAIH